MAIPYVEAERVLKEHLATSEGKISVPIDLGKLTENFKIVVKKAALKPEISGAILRKAGDPTATILVNENDGAQRQRFTIAHELGHFIKRNLEDPSGAISYVDLRDPKASQGTDAEEVWANAFAAALLMPANAVRAVWARGVSIDALAELFGVSSQSALIRLKTLRLSY